MILSYYNYYTVVSFLHRSMQISSEYLFINSLTLQTTKAVYNRIIDLKIATPQIIINFGLFLEENNYFEEAFKAYERGVALFKWPHLYDIWNTYLTKFVKRYVSWCVLLCVLIGSSLSKSFLLPVYTG